MEPKKLLGRRVRDLRVQKGLKIADLADLIGFAEESTGHIERGSVWPRYDTLEKLAQALETPLTEFFVYFPKSARDATALGALIDIAVQLEDEDIELLTENANAFLKRRTRTPGR